MGKITVIQPSTSGGPTTIPVPVTDGGTGTSTQFTQGSVVFAGPAGVYAQDNANFFWNDTLNRLGIKTNAPAFELDVQGTIYALDFIGLGALAGPVIPKMFTTSGDIHFTQWNGMRAALLDYYGGALNLQKFATTDLEVLVGGGKMRIGAATPTSYLHLKAGVAGANGSTLKMPAGVVLTVPETGAWEFDGTHVYFTIAGVRYQIDQQGPSVVLASGAYTPVITNNVNLAASTAYSLEYSRVGTKVSISGQIGLQATIPGLIIANITIPIASAFAANTQAGGTLFEANTLQSGLFFAEVGAGTLGIVVNSTALAMNTFSFEMGYKIV